MEKECLICVCIIAVVAFIGILFLGITSPTAFDLVNIIHGNYTRYYLTNFQNPKYIPTPQPYNYPAPQMPAQGSTYYSTGKKPQNFPQNITNSLLIGGINMGDYLGAEVPSMTGSFIQGLADRVIYTPSEKATYSQSILFSLPNVFSGGLLSFESTISGDLSEFMEFRDDVFAYQLVFSPELRGMYQDGQVPEFADRQLNLLGQDFTIEEMDVNNVTNEAKLVLFGPLGKYEFYDSNFADSKYTQGVRINGEWIDANVRISASLNNNVFSIASITYYLTARAKAAGDSVLVPPKHGVQEFLQYPEGMLSPQFDIVYGGLMTPASTSASLPQGSVAGGNVVFIPTSTGYDLTFLNNYGQRYRIPFIQGDGTLSYGRNSNILRFVEQPGYFINQGDYIMVSSGTDTNAVTNILKFDITDLPNGLVHFTDMAGGSPTAHFDQTTGEGTLNVNGFDYGVKVNIADPTQITVDFNRDGAFGSGKSLLELAGGSYMDLGSPGSSIVVKYITPARLFQTPTVPEITDIVFSQDNRVDVSVSGLSMLRDKDGVDKGMTIYGTLFLLDARVEPGTLSINYPSGQAMPVATMNKPQSQAFIVVTLERNKYVNNQ